MKHIILRTLTITTYCIMLTPYSHGMEVTSKGKKSQNFPIAQHNPGISDGEKAYLKKRLPIKKAAIEKLLGYTLDEKQVPTIAIIGSGGGYRAKLCTTGSLCGAKKIGLLDATTYLTALSGSTWCVGPWIATKKSIYEFKEYIKECAAKSFLHFTLEEEELVAEALLKKRNVSPFTPVDPYGWCLANKLLSSLEKKRQTITLSDLAPIIEEGDHPYIIFTAIDGRESIITGQNWYEFTVHAVGDRTNNIFIPTSMYGKEFINGTLTKHGHKKSLGYVIGTCGSAFGANVDEMLKEVVKNPAMRKEIESKIPASIEGKRPLHFYAEVPNYMHKMNDVQDATLPAEKHLKFVDSGLEINLPYPPVSGICQERTSDILIFLDASAGHIGNELQHVVDYAQQHNLPFPAIDFTDIDKKTISIFKDEHDPKVPVVIYMPRISDKDLWEQHKSDAEFAEYNLSGFDLDHETNNGFAETKNFQYAPEHSTLVTNQTEFNMHVNKKAIIEAIKWVVDRKK